MAVYVGCILISEVGGGICSGWILIPKVEGGICSGWILIPKVGGDICWVDTNSRSGGAVYVLGGY